MQFTIQTKGHADIINITSQTEKAIRTKDVNDGVAVIFIAGSTAAITTMEYETGVVKDFKNILEKIAPEHADYEHHQRWGDRNGAAHIKSALIGTSLTVLINNGKLILGTWQQIVLIDFDERPRTREVLVKFINKQ